MELNERTVYEDEAKRLGLKGKALDNYMDMMGFSYKKELKARKGTRGRVLFRLFSWLM